MTCITKFIKLFCTNKIPQTTSTIQFLLLFCIHIFYTF